MLKFLDRIRDWGDAENPRLRRFIGLAVSCLTMLALIACVSYIFTWKQDQSMLADSSLMKSQDAAIANTGGKVGLKIAGLLVYRWFGLGAFAVVFALGVLSVRLVFGKRKFSVLKTIVLALTGAALVSFIFAFFSGVLGAKTVLGSGLGGQCGDEAVRWLENLFGVPVSLFILVILSVAWMIFSSRRFSEWFAMAGMGSKTENEPEPESKALNGDGTITYHDSGGSVPVVDFISADADLPIPSGNGQRKEEIDSPEPVNKQEGTSAEVGADESLNVIDGPGLSVDVKDEPMRELQEDQLENYTFPSLNILKDYTSMIHSVSDEEIKRNNCKIRATLETYKISVDYVTAVVGATVTLYKVTPASGVRISSIMNLHKEIGLSLGSKNLRIVMLPDSVGIEVPNDTPSVVPLKALLNDEAFRNTKAELPVAIGYTITQKVKVFDLADAPHLLVAGATKQGKSVGLNVLIASLLFSKSPSDLKMVFIDPKMVEFSAYSKLLHHYLAVLPTSASEEDEMNNAIVKKAPDAEAVLRSLCIEMDERYELLSKASVNNIVLYNRKYADRRLLPTEGHHHLPYIVTVIDEYADLTMSTGAGGEARTMAKSITNSIIRLAQKGRAAGIHIVLATQRPSVDIITGAIKTNFPTRIAFRVISRVDSQTILDSPGAEKLIGKGDMLYYAGVEMERVQCALIGNDEIAALTEAIGSQQGYKKSYSTPYYLPAPDEGKVEDGSSSLDVNDMDERFEEAARMVVTSGKGSTSDLQRRLSMGYAKAGRVMDQLESAGIVGPQEGSKPRQVLINDLDELELRIKELKMKR